jgi:RimJ/RimL family protein N-acetyltransferase
VLTAQPLKTTRLTLEALTVGHAAEMVAVLADPALYEYIGGEPPSEPDLVARHTRQTSRDHWLNWILREQASGDAVGTVQATLGEHAAELAWVVSTRAQGKGYATEATAAVIAWLRENDVRELVAHVNPDHAASRAVAARLGFQPTESIKNGEVRWELSTRCHN